MSAKSPVSSICREAWTKRASSRSEGGSVVCPGQNAASAASSSAARRSGGEGLTAFSGSSPGGGRMRDADAFRDNAAA